MIYYYGQLFFPFFILAIRAFENDLYGNFRSILLAGPGGGITVGCY